MDRQTDGMLQLPSFTIFDMWVIPRT